MSGWFSRMKTNDRCSLLSLLPAHPTAHLDVTVWMAGLTRRWVKMETTSVLLSEFIFSSLPSLGKLTTVNVIVLFPALSSLVTALRALDESGSVEPKIENMHISAKHTEAANSSNDLSRLMETAWGVHPYEWEC